MQRRERVMGDRLVVSEMGVDRVGGGVGVAAAERGDQVDMRVLAALVFVRVGVEPAETDADVAFGGPPERHEDAHVPRGRSGGEEREVEGVMGLVDGVHSQPLVAELDGLPLEMVQVFVGDLQTRASSELALQGARRRRYMARRSARSSGATTALRPGCMTACQDPEFQNQRPVIRKPPLIFHLLVAARGEEPKPSSGVRLGTETVRGEETVSGEVRNEQIEVDDPTDGDTRR